MSSAPALAFPGSRTLAFALDGSLTGRDPDHDIYVACNAWRDAVNFRIPPSPNGRFWQRAIDTALPSPLDVVGLDEGPRVPAHSVYPVAGHSLLVLIAESYQS